jgi:hypothetical protein
MNATLEQRHLDMPMGEFLRELVLGRVTPPAVETVEQFCTTGNVAYWNRRLRRGDLPLVHVGRLIDLTG